jgi:hypothetical protein
MSIKKTLANRICVRAVFEGWHRWPDAPEEHKFLSYPHRHMFYVYAQKEVSHTNREIEIIELKRQIQQACEHEYGVRSLMEDGEDCLNYDRCSSYSCEDMGRWLCEKFDLVACIVLEDDENGASTYETYAPVSFFPADVEIKPIPDNDDVSVLKHGRRYIAGELFTGIEAEGPHRGVRTVFVPGDTSFDDMFKVLKDEVEELAPHEIRNLYLGADNVPIAKLQALHMQLISPKHLFDLRCKFTTIWIETTDVNADEFQRVMPKGVLLVYVIPAKKLVDPFRPKTCYIKQLYTDCIEWNYPGHSAQYVTRYDDPLFAKDKAL